MVELLTDLPHLTQHRLEQVRGVISQHPGRSDLVVHLQRGRRLRFEGVDPADGSIRSLESLDLGLVFADEVDRVAS